MKVLALLTPAAMLAALWALQRLEVWMSEDPGPGSRGAPRGAARTTTRRQGAHRRWTGRG